MLNIQKLWRDVIVLIQIRDCSKMYGHFETCFGSQKRRNMRCSGKHVSGGASNNKDRRLFHYISACTCSQDVHTLYCNITFSFNRHTNCKLIELLTSVKIVRVPKMVPRWSIHCEGVRHLRRRRYTAQAASRISPVLLIPSISILY